MVVAAGHHLLELDQLILVGLLSIVFILNGGLDIKALPQLVHSLRYRQLVIHLILHAVMPLAPGILLLLPHLILPGGERLLPLLLGGGGFLLDGEGVGGVFGTGAVGGGPEFPAVDPLLEAFFVVVENVLDLGGEGLLLADLLVVDVV